MFDKLGKLAYNSDLESLKSSVSEGKKLIAAAVTDKGVETAADATFQTMANNIGSISKGVNIDFDATSISTSQGYNRSTIDATKYSQYCIFNGDTGYALATYTFIAVDRLNRVGVVMYFYTSYSSSKPNTTGWYHYANLYGGVYTVMESGTVTLSDGGDTVSVGNKDIFFMGK